MADAIAPAKPKTKRQRRDFRRDLEIVRSYCKVSIEILSEEGPIAASETTNARIETFKKVLHRIETL